jgi:hypothetical protein
MTINSRTKGQTGERAIATKLNGIVVKVRQDRNLPVLNTNDLPFQRNQNQSAVGGDDLTNPYYLSIEVKRQEALSINTWWKQCVASAERFKGVPILVFKQNHKAWRVIMNGHLRLDPLHVQTYASVGPLRCEVTIEVFEEWFKNYYERWLDANPQLS